MKDVFEVLQPLLSVSASDEMPDINKMVEKMRAPFRREKDKFLAKGTVTEKAAQYEIEFRRRRSDLQLGKTPDKSPAQRRRTVQFVGGVGFGASPSASP